MLKVQNWTHNNFVSRNNQKSCIIVWQRKAGVGSAWRRVSYASPHSAHVPPAAYARDLSVEINMRKWNIWKDSQLHAQYLWSITCANSIWSHPALPFLIYADSTSTHSRCQLKHSALDLHFHIIFVVSFCLLSNIVARTELLC